VATAVVRYTAAAVTDRGRKRSSNEDAFGYSVEHGVYIVCDGMGGAAAGEIASSLAVDEVLKLVTERVAERITDRATVHATGISAEDDAPSHHSLPSIAEEAVIAANHAIHSRAQRNTRLNGMGTTLVALLASMPEEDRRIWILNVGDSRCYRLRDRHIQLCTQDHSLVEEQVRLGRMSRSEAARSPLRNVITRALGTQVSVTPDLIEAEVEPGDLFLLCSDGLTRELSDEKIESILSTSIGGMNPESVPLDELCNRLIQAANKAGGHDNITCLIVRVD
jgi:serine/threonine protein phosphatase PrpC